jgi:hypothetical protein
MKQQKTLNKGVDDEPRRDPPKTVGEFDKTVLLFKSFA